MPKEGRNQGNVTTKGQTALVAGDFALGAGWGASTVAVTAGSNDHFGSIVITAATGGGLAQATATVTMTFKSAFSVAPAGVLVTGTNDNSAATHLAVTGGTATTTAATWTSSTIPVDTKLYRFTWFIPSRA